MRQPDLTPASIACLSTGLCDSRLSRLSADKQVHACVRCFPVHLFEEVHVAVVAHAGAARHLALKLLLGLGDVVVQHQLVFSKALGFGALDQLPRCRLSGLAFLVQEGVRVWADRCNLLQLRADPEPRHKRLDVCGV